MPSLSFEDVILILAGSGSGQPPIFVTVSEPIIQIVELGNTVRFSILTVKLSDL